MLLCIYLTSTPRTYMSLFLQVVAGSGRYIPNPAYSPFVYDKIEANEAARKMKEVSVSRSNEDMKIDTTGCEMPVEDPQPPAKDAEPDKPLDKKPEQPPQAATPPKQESLTTPAIDNKPQIRVRAPPGGKSSIFF